MNKVKQGTLWYGIQPEMVLLDPMVREIYYSYGYGCIRTAGSDKNHGTHSLHPPGFAIDYRTKHITVVNRIEILRLIEMDLKDTLPCCDVVLEDLGGENEHFHVEFDPKNDDAFQSAKVIYRETGMWPARW